MKSMDPNSVVSRFPLGRLDNVTAVEIDQGEGERDHTHGKHTTRLSYSIVIRYRIIKTITFAGVIL